jgi:RNA polymerase sigma-70 factor, ECF subfamily
MDREQIFQEERPRLFAIAYRMLGSVMDAEDAVQDTFLRWQQLTDQDLAVTSPRAYLTTILTRRCIDLLRSARVRREQYVGPWLPEPIVTEPETDPAEMVALADSLSTAFLVLLERLSPTERAVFLLREAFEYDYAEIAQIIGTSEANCRQLLARARKKIAEGRPRFSAPPKQQQRLATAFGRASFSGDLDGLIRLLSDDVTLWADGGGKVTAARQPIHGPDRVARFVLGALAKAPPNLVTRPVMLNGQTGFVSLLDGQPFLALTLDVADDRIRGLYLVANPDKLRGLTRAIQDALD